MAGYPIVQYSTVCLYSALAPRMQASWLALTPTPPCHCALHCPTLTGATLASQAPTAPVAPPPPCPAPKEPTRISSATPAAATASPGELGLCFEIMHIGV